MRESRGDVLLEVGHALSHAFGFWFRSGIPSRTNLYQNGLAHSNDMTSFFERFKRQYAL